jgi:hypothetical protein
MEIGNFKLWKPIGGPFPKSGQGKARKVTRDGDDASYVLKRM